jgi:hypothetical protein
VEEDSLIITHFYLVSEIFFTIFLLHFLPQNHFGSSLSQLISKLSASSVSKILDNCFFGNKTVNE